MKIIVFLLITFTWAWVSWFAALHHLPFSSTSDNAVTYFFIGIYAPAVSAIITTLLFGGFYKLLMLFKKLIIWKIPLEIYLIIIFLPLVFLGSGIALYSLTIGDVGKFNLTAVTAIPSMLLSSIIGGPLGEELGWRGFLLPELQKKFTPVTSSLIIGVIWYLWHVPLFFASSGTLVSGSPLTFFPLFTFLVYVICLSCIYTWLVNNSKGSILVAILIHLSINASIAWLFFPALSKFEYYKTLNFLATPSIVLFTLYIIFKTKLKSTFTNKTDDASESNVLYQQSI